MSAWIIMNRVSLSLPLILFISCSSYSHSWILCRSVVRINPIFTHENWLSTERNQDTFLDYSQVFGLIGWVRDLYEVNQGDLSYTVWQVEKRVRGVDQHRTQHWVYASVQYLPTSSTSLPNIYTNSQMCILPVISVFFNQYLQYA